MSWIFHLSGTSWNEVRRCEAEVGVGISLCGGHLVLYGADVRCRVTNPAAKLRTEEA